MRAKGGTYRGVPFTREQMLNAAVFYDIHQNPGGPSSTSKDDWCRLLSCLLNGKTLSREFEARCKKKELILAASGNV